MRVLLGLLGFTIIFLAILDTIWTTLGRHGGPFTDKISSWIWSAALRYHRSFPSHRALSVIGLGIVLVVIGVWLFLPWLGWGLIFSIDKGALINSNSGQPAGIMDRFYFAGYTLWTLGIGDFIPQGAAWQIATVLANIHGFFLITLSVSFLIPVISAANEKRQLSAYISSLGKTPDEIILNIWNGTDCEVMERHLMTLMPLLAKLEQLYPAYPVLHYFHITQRNEATAPSIAVLDEALTLVEYGIRGECQPNPAVLHPVRHLIHEFLNTLRVGFIESVAEAPPTRSLDRLRSGGIPTVSDGEFRAAVSKIAERRRLLLEFIKNDGWLWEDAG